MYGVILLTLTLLNDYDPFGENFWKHTIVMVVAVYVHVLYFYFPNMNAHKWLLSKYKEEYQKELDAKIADEGLYRLLKTRWFLNKTYDLDP